MLHSKKLLSCLCAVSGALAAGAVSTPAQAASAPQFTIYGFAQADYIYDINRVDPAWEDTLRPSKIPTEEGVFGSDGQSCFSAKQSRFGVKGDIPVGGGFDDITFKFEFDMFGVGVDAGQTTIRLRHAYGEWGQLLAGQTNSVFMDGDIFPNIDRLLGADGHGVLRNVADPLDADRATSTTASRSRSSSRATTSTSVPFASSIPNSAPICRTTRKLPDLTAHYNYHDSWGHVQLAAILRNVGYDTVNTPNNEPKGSELGWGVNLTGHVNVLEKDKAASARRLWRRHRQAT